MRFFFFNDTSTTEIYTLSLHDALPILSDVDGLPVVGDAVAFESSDLEQAIGPVTDHGNGVYSAVITASTTMGTAIITVREDRKSTRLNSSHSQISYAVFCLKKKKKKEK